MKKIIILYLIPLFALPLNAQEDYSIEWAILEHSLQSGSAGIESGTHLEIVFDSITSSLIVFDNAVLGGEIMRCGKYNKTGEKLWDYTYHHPLDASRLVRGQCDNQGNVLILGNYIHYIPQEEPKSAFSLFKLSTDGELIWLVENNIDPDISYLAEDFLMDTGHNIYVYGSSINLSSDTRASFLKKYNADGVLEWTKTEPTDYIRGIYEIDEQIGLLGITDDNEFYFSKRYTKAGALINTHYSLIEEHHFNAGVSSKNGGSYHGTSAHKYGVLKMNDQGQILWQYEKPIQLDVLGNRLPYFLEDEELNLYGIGGYVYGANDVQVLITKIDSLGNYLWEQKVDGEGMQTYTENVLWADAVYIPLLYFNPGQDDKFGVVKYAKDGQLSYSSGSMPASDVGFEHRFWPYSVALDDEENIYLAGKNEQSNYDEYLGIVKFKKAPNAIPEVKKHLPLSLSPNPANNELSIQLTGGGEVSIYNSFGQLISQHHYENFAAPIKINQLHSGIYIIKVQQNDKLYLGKLEKL